MTTPVASTTPPKKNYMKIALMVIGVGLSVIGLDRFTFDILPIGAHITLTDKEISASAITNNIPGSTAGPGDNGSSVAGMWVGKRVIIKQNSALFFLIPFPTGQNYFDCTGDNGSQIHLNGDVSTWFPKSEFELLKTFTPNDIGISDSGGANDGLPSHTINNLDPHNQTSGAGHNTYVPRDPKDYPKNPIKP